MKLLDVVIVGGGAITEQLYLSYFNNHAYQYSISVIERNQDRLDQLKIKYPFIKNTHTDYKDVLGKTDIAIIALPNFLHAPVAADFIKSKTPVFIEKPLAINYTEAVKLAELAKKMDVPIAAGLVKRFYESSTVIKNIIEAELFGKVRSVLISDGNEFSWPLQSDSLIDRKKSGGGVLIDVGAHLLDLLCWWIGLPEIVSYSDDNCGNIETECHLQLSKESIHINVELSRLRTLQQQIEIFFERGSLNYYFGGKKPVLQFSAALPKTFSFSIEADDNLKKAFGRQIEAFVAQCDYTNNNPIKKENILGLESLQLISACYDFRG